MDAMTSDAPILVTSLGHGNRTQGELVELLRGAGLELLIDVRRFPGSKRHPHMRKAELEVALPAAGFEYRHAVDLGGYRDPCPDSPHDGLLDDASRGYADHMQTPLFRRAFLRLLELAAQRRTAIMCAEMAPTHCHRAFLCDALLVHGARVEHLLAPGRVEPHALHPRAQPRDDGGLLYRAPDAGQASLFGASGN